MDRRRFLVTSLYAGISLVTGNTLSFAQTFLSAQENIARLKQFLIIDAHEHILTARDMGDMEKMGMAVCAFNAIGDEIYLHHGRRSGTEYQNTLYQLDSIQRLINAGKARPVFRASDIPTTPEPGSVPGAILAIEGGDPLEGNPDRVNDFYQRGVRMITVVHYRINEIGDIMTVQPKHRGLTKAGKEIIERMQSLGMVVDVAHMHTDTLKQVAAMSSRPLVDSHTSPCYQEDAATCGRLRTWRDMELIVKTGGLICTWPYAHRQRNTFQDWAKELLEMKKRLGIEHIGLGTDAGGRLPRTVKGYNDLRDLGNLVKAMEDTGFTSGEITLFLGGNCVRVFRTCIG